MGPCPFLFQCHDHCFIPLCVRKNCHGSSCKYPLFFPFVLHAGPQSTEEDLEEEEQEVEEEAEAEAEAEEKGAADP